MAHRKSNACRVSLGLLLAMAGFTHSAEAGTLNAHTIKNIGFSTNTTLVFVTFTTNLSSSAACSDADDRLVFDHTSAKGKATLSLLTTAYLSGKKVYGGGLGTCTTTPVVGFSFTIETLSAITIQDS